MDDDINLRLKSLPVELLGELRGVYKTKSQALLIPAEPVGKGRPRFTRKGRCYTPKSTVLAEQCVKTAGISQYQGKPMTGPLGVELLAISPIPKSWSQKKQAEALTGTIRPDRKPDFDNLVKLYCDALNGILWEDDKQIVDGRCIKIYGARPGVVLWCWNVLEPVIYDCSTTLKPIAVPQ